MRFDTSILCFVLSAVSLSVAFQQCSAFVPPSAGLGLRPHGTSGVRSAVRSRAPALSAVSMIYTPPRVDADEEAALDALRDRLDRTVKIPSQTTKLPSTRRTKETVQRSPCTSLYGNWRPTTGTEPYRKATRTKAVIAKVTEVDENAKPKQRGRPPSQPKPAVLPEQLPEFVARASQVLEMNGGQMDSNLFGQQWKVVHVNSPLYAFKSTKAVTIHQMLRENGEFFEVSETDRQKVKMFTLKPDQTTTFLEQCRGDGRLADDLEGPAEMVSRAGGVPIEARGSPAGRNEELPPLQAQVEDVTPLDGPGAGPEPEVVYEPVPVHGRQRMASHDRRVLMGRKQQKKKERRVKVEEELPAAPLRHADDAVVNGATSLYNSWAMDGRDVVMEVTHRTAFDELWAVVAAEQEEQGGGFTAVDAGCGNGWAARLMAQHELCEGVTAVDGAALMIEKAGQSHERDVAGLAEDQGMASIEYRVADVETWFPAEAVDVALFGETLYLLEDPEGSLQHVVNAWLKPGGRVVASLDCYRENKLSHTWEEDLGVRMHCYGEGDWQDMFKVAGLTDVQIWRAKAAGPWQGTLIVTGTKA